MMCYFIVNDNIYDKVLRSNKNNMHALNFDFIFKPYKLNIIIEILIMMSKDNSVDMY
jgi:hypothetical protein